MKSETHKAKGNSITNSALWAAYGDALGFISELTDLEGLRRRISSERLTSTVAWKRRVGGRYGVEVELPAGTYSDDTQLRLSTSRAIRGDGTFDVEVFSKIELPVWLSYALGGGKGTKTAAANLSKTEITWATNFYTSPDSGYTMSGGNGAAMRIQPHVWAFPDDGREEALLSDVIRNTISTHGHPRALAGAVFHALSLQSAIASEQSPIPSKWLEMGRKFEQVLEIINSQPELRDLWLPLWNKVSSFRFEDVFRETLVEIKNDLEIALRVIEEASEPSVSYRKIVHLLGATEAASRGSGIKTAIVATVLAWLFRDKPNEGLLEAANFVESDTDTIATMAGAILGVSASSPPEGQLLDAEYIAAEAMRMYFIRRKMEASTFAYPDLLTWTPPRTASDAIGVSDGLTYLAGLGKGEIVSSPYEQGGKHAAVWEWMELEFGQHILAKRRPHPGLLNTMSLPLFSKNDKSYPGKGTGSMQPKSEDMDPKPLPVGVPRPVSPKQSSSSSTQRHSVDLDEVTQRVIDSGFDAELVGQILLELAVDNEGIERSIAFAAIVAKALKARLKRKPNPRLG